MVIKTMIIKQQNVKCKESYDTYFEERSNKIKLARHVIIPQEITSHDNNNDPLQIVTNVTNRDTNLDNVSLKHDLMTIYEYGNNHLDDQQYDKYNDNSQYDNYDCCYSGG